MTPITTTIGTAISGWGAVPQITTFERVSEACVLFIQSLSYSHRSAFILSSFFKQTAREIATAFNMTELQVRAIYVEIRKSWEEHCQTLNIRPEEGIYFE
jgi:DNA-directed RNA polymerase specialized sigma24 family protein